MPPAPSGVDLSVIKTVSNSRPRVGQTVTYTITVRNLSSRPATGVVVREQPHSSLRLGTVTPSQGSYQDNRWNVGTLAPGARATLTVAARVTSSSRVPNTATLVSVDQGDSNPANNRGIAYVNPGNSGANPTATPIPVTATPVVPTEPTMSPATAVPPTPDTSLDGQLEVNKQADRSEIVAGQPVKYTVTVRNTGPGTATNVVVTDRVPSAYQVVNASSSQGQVNVAGQTVTITTPVLAPGETVIVTILTVATNDAAGVTVNSVIAEANFGPRVVNETFDAEVKITRQPGLARSGAAPEGIGTFLGLLTAAALLAGGLAWRRRKS